MSRSYRKHPIEKWGDSEKDDKRNSNRKFRRKNKQKDYEEDYEEKFLYNKVKEVSNNWDWSGEHYKRYSPNKPESKRK